MKDADFVGLDELVEDLLGLRPNALRAMADLEPTEDDRRWRGTCRVGFSIFLRRVLTQYLALCGRGDSVVTLETEGTAREAGWPDARTANVGLLLTWALLLDVRGLARQPPAPLVSAGGNVVPLAQRRLPAELLPAHVLAGRVTILPSMSGPITVALDTEAVRAPGRKQVPSTNALIRDLLGLDPRVLAHALCRPEGEPGSLYEEDAELAGRMGLQLLMRDVLTQYHTMKMRATEEVRLMGEHDARDGDRPDARSANLATLMSAGLMCEDGWAIHFFPALPYSQQREDLLAAMAHEVDRLGSLTAIKGFRLVCDDNIHFGTQGCNDKGSRLLHAAYRKRQRGQDGSDA